MAVPQPLKTIAARVTACEKCPRLRDYCHSIAQTKKKAYLHENYWGKPVPGWGAPDATLFVLGLAPGAHGANRTGRMVTGDRSGDWLYRAMFRAGYANQSKSVGPGDGLELIRAYVTCLAKCAPPENLPNKREFELCAPYWHQELEALPQIRVILALGRLAFEAVLKKFGQKKQAFRHGLEVGLPGGLHLIASYHPSQQNTFTGVLTESAFDAVFERAKLLS